MSNYGANPQTLTFETTFAIESTKNVTQGSSPANLQYIVFQQNSRTTSFDGFSLQYNESSESLTLVATNPHTREQHLVRTPEGLITVGSLVHVVCVLEIDKMHIYVDGRMEATGRKWSGGIDYSSTHKLTLARANPRGTVYDGYMNGTIYEFSLFENVLSDGEVKYLYNDSKQRLSGC